MDQVETMRVKEAARAMNWTLTYVFQLLWAGRLEGARKEGKR